MLISQQRAVLTFGGLMSTTTGTPIGATLRIEPSYDVLKITALAIAGLAFAFYPLLRGSSTEVGFGGAELYARPTWLLAHCLGMAGFITAAWGLSTIDRLAGRLAFGGTLLVLPYYGAEAFGLNAIGRLALQTHDPSGVAAANMFRYQPVAITAFGVGLLLLAAAGVRLLQLVRRGPGLRRLGLLITGLGLLTYLPQFFAPIEGRIAHGIALGLGLLVLAVTAGHRRRQLG